MSALEMHVTGNTEGEPSGFDSAIIRVPARWYVTVDGKPAFLAQLAGRDLRAASDEMAARVGETLHHGDWVITADPGQVSTFGMMHECATCQAGVDQALAYLRDNPGGEVAVGQLWWAAHPRPEVTA